MSINTLGVGAIPRSVEAITAVSEVRAVSIDAAGTDVRTEPLPDGARVPEATSKASALTAATRDLETSFPGMRAQSSSSGVVATVTGPGAPRAFNVKVSQVATRHRVQSNPMDSSTAPLGMSGDLVIGLPTGESRVIAVSRADGLADIAVKVKLSGAPVAADVVFDAGSYRLRLTGIETGAKNAISVKESGVSLGFSDAANTTQTAGDARLTVNGATTTRASNQVPDVVPGVTLGLTHATPVAARVDVQPDPDKTVTALKGVVRAYNDVAKTAQIPGPQAPHPRAAQAQAERAIDDVAQKIGVPAGDRARSWAAIGVARGSSGTLSLDETKLRRVLAAPRAGPTNGSSGT